MAGKEFFGNVASTLCRYLGVKIFIEISLSRMVSKINAFYAEIQDGRKSDFWEKLPVDCIYSACQNFVEIYLSRTVFKINGLLRFTQKFKMAT